MTVPLFQLIMLLTLLIVLIIIQRLYHGLRILNSRVDILSSLIKNMKEDFRKQFQNHTEDEALQEYLHNESILQAKMSRDFAYQVPKKPSLRGQNLMRSDIHTAVTSPVQPTEKAEEPDNKPRFKRHPSFSIPMDTEKTPGASLPPAPSSPLSVGSAVDEKDSALHTLSQSHISPDLEKPKDVASWDASPTLLSGQALQPTGTTTFTVQEHTQNPLQSTHAPLQHTPTALEHLTFQDVTYKKLTPPDPARLFTQEGEPARSLDLALPTQDLSTHVVPRQVEPTQHDEHPFESLTMRKESDHPSKPMGLSRLEGLFEHMERTVDTAISNPLTTEDTTQTAVPSNQDTAISSPPQESDTAITARPHLLIPPTPETSLEPSLPVTPSQENLLSTDLIGDEGSELRIKKDLSYVVKTSSSGKSQRESKPLSVEQIPSLSFLSKKKDQGS